jgi:hypothetical protein
VWSSPTKIPVPTSVTEPASGVRLEARHYRWDRWVCRDG